MKYTNEVIINAPIDRVIKLFDDPANLPKWQPGLISFEPLTGTPGQPGATSRLRYKMGKREMEMIETITKRDLPREFSGTYEMNGVKNWIANRFEKISDNQTKVVTDNEFKFTGFMRIMGWLMPGVFRKQSQQFLDQFKVFVESN